MLAFIHFVLTIDTLIAGDTLTPVATDEVAAGGPVPAGVGGALVQLLLAVAPRVARGTLAVMRVASVDTDTRVLAQVVKWYSFVRGCLLTGDTGHVTVSASPSRGT